MMKQTILAKERKTERSKNKKLLEAMTSEHTWPTADRMKDLVELTSLSEIAKAVGVSVTCISMKCRKLGLRAKPPEYWSHRPRLKAEEVVSFIRQ
jgi:hypothetical protein